MALFFFLIWILMWRLKLFWIMRAFIYRIFSSLLVFLDDFANYFDIFLFDFILKLQLLNFKFTFKCQNVLFELVLKVFKSFFKFLEVIFVRGKHAFKVFHDSVDLNFDVGIHWLLKRLLNVLQNKLNFIRIGLDADAFLLNFIDLLWK